MRTLTLFLIFIATPSYAVFSIDDVFFDYAAKNSECSITSQEFFISIQASTFYHQYDIEQFLGEKPQQRRLHSYLCNNQGVSIYYYEYKDKTQANNSFINITSFIWNNYNTPSQEHPEVIIVIENIVVVISGENISTLENRFLDAIKTKNIKAISIGRQIEMGRLHLQNQHYEKAVSALKPVAALNHTGAQNGLCEIFLVALKSNEAVKWCTKAANSGSSEAQIHLAKMYLTNKWLKPNLDKAIALLRNASAAGNIKADSLLKNYAQYKTTDITEDTLNTLENHLRCANAKNQNIIFACSSLELFRKGIAINSDTLNGMRLVGVGVAFNNSGNKPPIFELAGLEFQKNDAVSDKFFSFRATATEPGETEMINDAINALLNGNVPNDNFAYQFVASSPISSNPSLAWKDSTNKSTGSIVDGFRMLFRKYKNTITALKIHPQDPQILANRFYIIQYKIKHL